jgi:hypothetical protein
MYNRRLAFIDMMQLAAGNVMYCSYYDMQAGYKLSTMCICEVGICVCGVEFVAS